MYKTVVIPKRNAIRLPLPNEFVGKEIEIMAHLFKRKTVKRKKKNTINELKEFYKRYHYDVKGLKLTRDEANER